MTANNTGTGRRNARHEWITGESARTLTDSDVVAHGTLGVDTARRRAWIDAAEVMTDFVVWAFAVF